MARREVHAVMEAAHIVSEVLGRPTAVFEGIRRDEDEDDEADGWFCYCGKPRYAYNRDGSQRPPYEHEVFLVFVNAEGVAYNWRWEKCDEDDASRPNNHATRFSRQVYP